MIITALQKWGLGVYMEGATSIDPSLFINCHGWKNKRRGRGVGGSAREKKTKKGIELMPKAAALNTVVFTSLL